MEGVERRWDKSRRARFESMCGILERNNWNEEMGVR